MPVKPPMDFLKTTKKRRYNREYMATKRFVVTSSIRATKEEAALLRAAKRQMGISWLRVLFRGLGLKRPSEGA